jgi:hypothetical protein
MVSKTGLGHRPGADAESSGGRPCAGGERLTLLSPRPEGAPGADPDHPVMVPKPKVAGIIPGDLTGARVMVKRDRPAVHPFAPILFGAIVAAVLGIAYLVFGVGKDAFAYMMAAVAMFAIPVVVVFGITGLVIAIRRLF